MRKSRFTEAQMAAIRREADKGPVAEVAKKHAISEQSIYTWRKQWDGRSLLKRHRCAKVEVMYQPLERKERPR